MAPIHVSVVLPVYDGAAHVGAALDSVLSQDTTGGVASGAALCDGLAKELVPVCDRHMGVTDDHDGGLVRRDRDQRARCCR